MFFWIKLIAIGLIVAGLVAACNHRDNGLIARGAAAQREVDQAEADKLKAAAVLAMDDALKAKSAAERRLADFKNIQEVTNARNTQTIQQLNGRLATLAAGTAGRLRDPNAAACGPGSPGGGATAPATATASPGDDHRAQTAGLLSAELTGLLQRLASEADQVNAAYIACRADAYSVRGLAAP